MKITITLNGDRYDDIFATLQEAARQLDLNDLDKMRKVGFIEKRLVTKAGIPTLRYDKD